MYWNYFLTHQQICLRRYWTPVAVIAHNRVKNFYS